MIMKRSKQTKMQSLLRKKTDPEQNEVPKWTEPDLPITAGTKSGNRKRPGMRYNR